MIWNPFELNLPSAAYPDGRYKLSVNGFLNPSNLAAVSFTMIAVESVIKSFEKFLPATICMPNTGM